MKRLLLLLVLTIAAAAGDWEPGADFHRLADHVATPHWPWVNVPLRVLAVGGRHCLRDAAELRQRFGCEVDIIPSEGLDQWTLEDVRGCEDLDTVVARHLGTLARPHDVIVIGTATVDWTAIPEALREAILATVRAGTGLLLAHPRNYPAPDLGIALDPTDLPGLGQLRGERYPEQDGCATLTEGRLGEGRVVELTQPDGPRNLLTGGPVTRPDYEHAVQFAMRALLLAADRPAAPAWRQLAVDGDTITGALAAPADVELHVFDLWEREVASVVWPAATDFVYALPDLPNGRYFARLRAGGNWGSLVFNRTDSPRLTSVAARQRLRYPGQPAQWDLAFDRLGATGLVARVFDRVGRLLAVRHLPVAETVELVIPSTTRDVYHELELDVLVGERVTDRRRLAFGVQQPVDCRDVNVGFWGRRGAAAYPEYWRQWYYRRLGMDMGMYALPPYHGVRMIDYAGYLPRIVWQPPEEPPPFPADPAFRATVRQSMTDRLATTAEWSPAAATLGDEPSYRWKDKSPLAMAAYRDWLRSRHGDLDALNTAWGTAYTAWEQVERVETWQTARRADIQAAAGRDSADFNLELTGDFYAWQQQLLNEQLPGLRAGPEGIWANPEYYSIDYPRLLRDCGFVGTYMAKDTMAAVRAFGRPDQLTGAWYGGYSYDDAAYLRTCPWQVVLEGLNSPMWFEGARLGTAPVPLPLTNPGWDLNAVTGPAWAEIARLKRGFGRLLLTSERLDTGIHVRRDTIARGAYIGWFFQVEALGHQATMALPDSPLDDARVLILGETGPVPDVDAVAAFVACGGLLVADRNVEGLDDFFGIRERLEPPRRATALLAWDDLRVPVDPGGVIRADHALGRLLPDGRPAVIERRLGKGRAVYLNAGLGNWEFCPGDVLALAARLLADVPPPVAVTTDQAHAAGLQVIRYRRGPLTLIALHRQRYRDWRPGAPGWADRWQVEVPMPRGSTVYDAYAGAPLGRLAAWRGPLDWGRPVLLACLPGPVAATAADTAGTPGQTVTVRFAFALPGATPYAGVAHLDFRRPDGIREPVLDRNVDIVDGEAVLAWPLALNEFPGAWRVTARDAATGTTATARVQVAARD